jgi:hypothetical protein
MSSLSRSTRLVVQSSQPLADCTGTRHVQRNSTWIFTTTFQGQQRLFDGALDACPFMSRAIELMLEHGEDVVLAFAARARKIAQQEQLDGQPLDAYVRLVRDCGVTCGRFCIASKQEKC